MMGKAVFHQILSNALQNMASRRSIADAGNDYEAIKHHTIAVKLVKEVISGVYVLLLLDEFVESHTIWNPHSSAAWIFTKPC